jgi:hypothetical protein
MTDHHFRISGGTPGQKVSWQVTGIRHDAYAEANRIPVEESKPSQERGYYLHPELFGQPQERSIFWAQRPQMLQKLRGTVAPEVTSKQEAGRSESESRSGGQ